MSFSMSSTRLALQDILAATLKRGQTLTDQEIATFRQQDAIESVYEKAFFYLSFRPRSEQEMRRYLRGKGLDDEHRASRS